MQSRYNQPRLVLPKRRRRRPTWWVGLVTLAGVVALAAAWTAALQLGLTATRSYDSPVPYYVFFGLSYVGLAAGAIYESSGHGLIYELHRDGQQVCNIVNVVVYTVVIFVWLKYHGDARLKK